MRLIDADEAYKVLTDYYHHRTEIQHMALKEAIERVPTIEAEPIRHGHWDNPTVFAGTCSVCGYAILGVIDDFKYCPVCGAKMDEVTE